MTAKVSGNVYRLPPLAKVVCDLFTQTTPLTWVERLDRSWGLY